MDLSEIIQTVDTLKAEIDTLCPIDAEQEARIMQKFRLDWNYHSNAIEGNTLTLGETRAFLLHGITAKGKPFKDYLDIKGHNEAIAYLEHFIRGQALLTEVIIREIHKILLVESYEVDALTPEGQPTKRRIEIGQYKTMSNHVRTSTSEVHYYVTPKETPAQMDDLMRWYRTEVGKGTLHPLILAATFHYRFVAIHPFDDGNGRMARLLTNLILMQAGYVPVIIPLTTKPEYLLALEQADAGELEDFIALIGQELIRSLELYLRGAKGESLDELGDLDKKVSLLQQRLTTKKDADEKEKQLHTHTKFRFFDNFVNLFLKELLSTLAKLKSLFELTTYSLTYNEHEIKSDSPLKVLAEIRQRNTDINRVQLWYRFRDLIGHKNLDIELKIEFNFQENKAEFHHEVSKLIRSTQHVHITPYHKSDKSFTYNHPFSQKEISDFVLMIANQISDVIEEQASESIDR